MSSLIFRNFFILEYARLVRKNRHSLQLLYHVQTSYPYIGNNIVATSRTSNAVPHLWVLHSFLFLLQLVESRKVEKKMGSALSARVSVIAHLHMLNVTGINNDFVSNRYWPGSVHNVVAFRVLQRRSGRPADVNTDISLGLEVKVIDAFQNTTLVPCRRKFWINSYKYLS